MPYPYARTAHARIARIPLAALSGSRGGPAPRRLAARGDSLARRARKAQAARTVSASLKGRHVIGQHRRTLCPATHSSHAQTPTAVDRLRGLLHGPTPQLIRVGVRNKGCAGMSYHLEYVDQPGKFDEVVEQDGVKVLIDSKALFSIIGSEMDWKEDALRCVSTLSRPAGQTHVSRFQLKVHVPQSQRQGRVWMRRIIQHIASPPCLVHYSRRGPHACHPVSLHPARAITLDDLGLIPALIVGEQWYYTRQESYTARQIHDDQAKRVLNDSQSATPVVSSPKTLCACPQKRRRLHRSRRGS